MSVETDVLSGCRSFDKFFIFVLPTRSDMWTNITFVIRWKANTLLLLLLLTLFLFI